MCAFLERGSTTIFRVSKGAGTRKALNTCCRGIWVLWPKKSLPAWNRIRGSKGCCSQMCVQDKKSLVFYPTWGACCLPLDSPLHSLLPGSYRQILVGGSSKRRKKKFAILMHKGQFLQTIFGARKRPPPPAAPPETQGASFSILVYEIISWREASYFQSKLFSN